MLFVAHGDCPLVRAETIFVSSQGRFFGCIETGWKLWSKSDQTWNVDHDERSYDHPLRRRGFEGQEVRRLGSRT